MATTLQQGSSDGYGHRLAALSALIRRVCPMPNSTNSTTHGDSVAPDYRGTVMERYAQHLCFDGIYHAPRSMRTSLMSESDWLVLFTASPSVCDATLLLAQDSLCATRSSSAASAALTLHEKRPITTFVCSGLNSEVVELRTPRPQLDEVSLIDAFKWLLEGNIVQRGLSATDIFYRSPWSRKIQRCRLPSQVQNPAPESVRKAMRDELLSLYRAPTLSSGWDAIHGKWGDAGTVPAAPHTEDGGGGASSHRIQTAVQEFIARLESTLNTTMAAYTDAYAPHPPSKSSATTSLGGKSDAQSSPTVRDDPMTSCAGTVHVREVTRSSGTVRSRAQDSAQMGALPNNRTDRDGPPSLTLEIVILMCFLGSTGCANVGFSGTPVVGAPIRSSLFDGNCGEDRSDDSEAEATTSDQFGIPRSSRRGRGRRYANRKGDIPCSRIQESMPRWTCQHTFVVTISPTGEKLLSNPGAKGMAAGVRICSAQLRHHAAHMFHSSSISRYPSPSSPVNEMHVSCRFSHEERRNAEVAPICQLSERQRRELVLQLCGGNELLLDTDEGSQLSQFADIVATDDRHLAELIGARVEAVDNSFVNVYVPRVLRQTLPNIGPNQPNL